MQNCGSNYLPALSRRDRVMNLYGEGLVAPPSCVDTSVKCRSRHLLANPHPSPPFIDGISDHFVPSSRQLVAERCTVRQSAGRVRPASRGESRDDLQVVPMLTDFGLACAVLGFFGRSWLVGICFSPSELRGRENRLGRSIGSPAVPNANRVKHRRWN
jgi:hypothetical protein